MIKGNSGCQIIFKDNIAIKSSKDKNYSRRLKKQCEKQKKFKSEYFQTPKIYKTSDDNNDIFWFEMEQIPYKTFDNFLTRSSKEDLNKISLKFINFIKNNITSVKKIDYFLLEEKFKCVKKSIYNTHGINLDYLNNVVYNLDKNIEVPVGYCHGDLTFSNMLFDKEKIALIDFLDTFYESPIQDIVKIRQDTKYFWSTNLINNNCDIVKIKQSLVYIDKIICKELLENYLSHCYKYFQIINLLRIIPYTKNKKIINHLLKEITNLCLL